MTRAATAHRTYSISWPTRLRARACSTLRRTSARRRRGPRDARHAGETKYTLRRMMKFALDAISSFSWLPLQAATLLGFVFSIVAFLGLPLVIVARIAGIYVPGVSTILFVILLLGGIQLITVGIIGEYVGRIYDEVKGRPLYVVREGRNIGGDEAPDEAPSEPQRVPAP